MNLVLLVRTRTLPGKRELVRELWEQLLKPRVDEGHGQPVYYFCEDEEDPDAFFLFQIYADKRDYEKAAESQHFADYMQRVGPLLAEPPKVSLARPVWAKHAGAQRMERIG